METSISHITVSSSECSDNLHPPIDYTAEKCDSIITIDSSDFERMHLSWRRRNKSAKCSSETPISNMQKVADWIKSIEECKHNAIERDGDSESIKSGNTQGIDNKGFVVVRCDYLKPITSQYENYNTLNYSKPKNTTTNPTKSCSILMSKQAEKPLKTGNDPKIKPTPLVNIADKLSLISSVEKASYSSSIKFVEEKSDISSDICGIPRSIESRKKELCTYLKLMDPTDKKEILALQNRRSTRVRNLAALQEKKQMEKKIKESSLENPFCADNQEQCLVLSKQKKMDITSLKDNSKFEQPDCNTNSTKKIINLEVLQKDDAGNEHNTEQSNKSIYQKKIPTLKSFEELNIQQPGSPHRDDKSIQHISEKTFYFPFPPKQMTIEVQNFDIVMKKLIPKLKISQRKLRKKTISNSSFSMKNVSINKENIECVKTGTPEENKPQSLPTSTTLSSTKNTLAKQLKSKLTNKLKYRNKVDLLSFRKTNHLSTRKLKDFNKFYNVKLRSAKFKIRFKRIPRKLLTKTKKTVKRSSSNIKVDRKITSNNPLQIPFENKFTEVQSDDQIVCEQHLEHKEDVLVEIRSVSNTGETDPQSKSENLNSLSEINNDTIQLQNLMVDINDFNNLSEEHKKCLIESRIFLTTPSCTSKSNPLFHSSEEMPPLYGFSTSDINEINLMCEIFDQSILKHCKQPLKHISDDTETDQKLNNNYTKINNELSVQNGTFCVQNMNEAVSNLTEHNHIFCQHVHNESTVTTQEKLRSSSQNSITTKFPEKLLTQKGYLEIDPNDVQGNICDLLPYDRNVEIKSLQKSLHYVKKKNVLNSPEMNLSQAWDPDEFPRPKLKRLTHYITINKEHGKVLRAFYVDFNLVVCQEFVVSFWMQTPLGNVLGSQNMWIPRGHTQRIVLNNKCIQKESKEMVFCSETNVAYIELWTKEHKSDIREGPVADIFITIYFWKQRQHGVEKKVLQLENINGFADDVQYCVMKGSPKIIVSWHVANEENVPRRTFIHAYQLASDYQMVSHISDIEPIEHYVKSLHNIEGCDNLIMGCGEKNITLWNVEYGYKIATIELHDSGFDFSTLWVKCDRGFLFAIQQCGTRELRLIAINGINHSWKKLASYFPSEGFDWLKGVNIENGLLVSFYDKGILCWKAETGEPVEEIAMDTDVITCGNYVIFLEDDKIFVRHCITHLLSMSVDEQL